MVEEQKDIIIANPMYDAVFKALMEDRENALITYRCHVLNRKDTTTGTNAADC